MVESVQTTSKSIKIWWGLIGSADVLKVLFGTRKETVEVAHLMIQEMKRSQSLSMTRRQVRLFAHGLDSGKFGVRYSYHNFYGKLVRKLLDLGLMEKGLVWSPERRTTIHVYQLKVQHITERPPSVGFVKQAWQVAKGWNDLIQGGS